MYSLCIPSAKAIIQRGEEGRMRARERRTEQGIITKPEDILTQNFSEMRKVQLFRMMSFLLFFQRLFYDGRYPTFPSSSLTLTLLN